MKTKVMLRMRKAPNKELRKFRNIVFNFLPLYMTDKNNLYIVEDSEYRVDQDVMYIYVVKG